MSALLLALLLPTLPAGDNMNPEVSTNVALAVSYEKLDYMEFSIGFADSASDELALAVGQDADGDGDLSIDEAAFVWGCDCGSWYFSDLETGETAPAPANAISVKREAFDPDWNLMKIVRRGTGDPQESVSVTEERQKFVISIR